MKHVVIPVSDVRTPAFWLAAEEYVAERWEGDEELWFTWRVAPCVVIGRNQALEKEIAVGYCRREGIGIFRRKSGGGAIYADLGNIMMSYIAAAGAVGYTFSKYIGLVVLLLQKLGVPAEASGRNDVVVEGKKVSGSAFLHLPGRNIAHGTLLYDTDMEHMTGALRPDAVKLKAKGVESVRSRVGLLKDYIDIGIDELEEHLIGGLCRGEELRLGEEDVRQIEERAEAYSDPCFLYGTRHAASLSRQRRIEGVGELRVDLVVTDGVIRDAWLGGDFFCCGKDAEALVAPLRGARYSHEGVSEALAGVLSEGVVMGLKREDFVDLIVGNDE